MAEYPEDENDEPVKKKKKKDPNAPKKNLNAWMFFIQQVRPSVVAELGEDGKRVATVTKVVGDRWSKMTAEEKAVRFISLFEILISPFNGPTFFAISPVSVGPFPYLESCEFRYLKWPRLRLITSLSNSILTCLLCFDSLF